VVCPFRLLGQLPLAMLVRLRAVFARSYAHRKSGDGVFSRGGRGRGRGRKGGRGLIDHFLLFISGTRGSPIQSNGRHLRALSSKKKGKSSEK